MITLQEGEYKIGVFRKHWIVIFSNAVVMAIFAVIPIAGLLYGNQVLGTWLQDNGVVITENNILFFSAAWVLFVWIMFVVMWTNYYLDVIMVTNKRILDIEQFILFSKDEVTIPLNRIEDVKIEVKGVFPTLLRYGNIQIQTAGAHREAIMKMMNNPEAIKNQIDELLQTVTDAPTEPVIEEQ